VESVLKFDRRNRDTYILPALLTCAFGLRVYGIDWGLPAGYEEATPFRKAWEMWNWGLKRGVDLNPHFFNYPSFTVYLQFAMQGLLYIAMTLTGFVSSTIEFHAQYVIDKTPYFVIGRLLNVAFATATVALVFVFGRRTGGYAVAIPSALWLAINTAHVSRSQMIEVDVPLAFFTLLTLWLLLEALDHPSLRRYIYAGIAIGIATSTKYTGVLLGLSVVAAYVISRRKFSQGSWKRGATAIMAAFLVAVAAFILTSPYVLLDSDTFLTHFAQESEHMRLGHFGDDESPTWLHYTRLITSEQLGWPIFLLAIGGILYCIAIQRKSWAVVACAFLVPYCIGVSTWEMRADRYLLPVLPLFCLFAGHALAGVLRVPYVSRWPSPARTILVGIIAVGLAVPIFKMYPDHLRRLRPNTRTVAGQWFLDNVPSGSFIVTEHYGPNFPVRLVELEPEVRSEIEKRLDYSHYAVQQIPMVQVRPEITGFFYDLSLYRDADYVITTSAVRSRYLGNTQRFARQAVFYEQLENTYQIVRRFSPDESAGPVITVYQNPIHEAHFGDRKFVEGPPQVGSRYGYSGAEATFYFWFGFNYESYSFYQVAYECYRWAMRYPEATSNLSRSLVLGSARCLVALDRHDEALELVDRAIVSAATSADRDYYKGIRERITINMD
jgi:4-amino-4-deoxy-L-arabinose transferase-like glycosyltransferase